MAVNLSAATKDSTYKLASQELRQNCTMCFTFYYYMYNVNNGSLNVNVIFNNTTHNRFHVTHTHEQRWFQGQIEITDIYTTYLVS